jgi:hypothetical protein
MTKADLITVIADKLKFPWARAEMWYWCWPPAPLPALKPAMEVYTLDECQAGFCFFWS